jgi:hypothetical protein
MSVAIDGEPVPPETVLHVGVATRLGQSTEVTQWFAGATPPESYSGPLGAKVPEPGAAPR